MLIALITMLVTIWFHLKFVHVLSALFTCFTIVILFDCGTL
jgi:hypothetical protein